MNLRRLRDLPLLLLAGLLLLPVLAVLGSWLSWNAASGQILGEMSATVLPGYAITSVLLCLAVGLGAAVVGTAGAGAVTLFDFPAGAASNGRCCCRWPCRPTWSRMRTPTSCSSAARCRPGCAASSGWKAASSPRCATCPAHLRLRLFLYPYVYLLVRTAFAERRRS